MKSFSKKRHIDPHTVKAIMKLLEDSPLPWTVSMLHEWFGHASIPTQVRYARMAGRIHRFDRGIYGPA